MSRVSSSIGAESTAGVSTTRRAARTRQPVRREVKPANVPGNVGYEHLAPDELLGKFWDFAQRGLSRAAASLISIVGAGALAGMVTGELGATLAEGEALRKARGRSMSPEVVATDLEITIPTGYTPNFDLYLQAVGIRPETDADRTTANEIKRAIKRKLADVRAGP